MNRRVFARLFGIAAVAVGLNACSHMGTTASLFDQLGGIGQVNKLSGNMMQSMTKNPALSGLMGNVNTTTATQKLSDQLCSALGGGCAAPYTSEQIANAANKLNPEQKAAVSDSFSSALKSVTGNSQLQETISKTLGSKLGGIAGSLL